MKAATSSARPTTAKHRPLVMMKQHDFLTMMRQLERHGEHRREAGAFLLASAAAAAETTRVHRVLNGLWHRIPTRLASASRHAHVDAVTAVAYYKDLDPGCLTGGITFHAIGYTRLSELCRSQGLRVVADIHLHPGNGTRQSTTDADHPMVACAGHLALIAPRLGAYVTTPDELGAHVMTTTGWASYFSEDIENVFLVRRTLRGLVMQIGTQVHTLLHTKGRQ
ncbi:hypothetical protein H5V45_09200 [Nocardioides sp. KIGAM211]|uniref:Uncharacterized protein n=1 Tax=Nocardioides luti TaxID=2761101 RepID=A0A7X0RFS6_9ACTN|nr:hypothetical protein [Nocardioides luti]MBB6627498.1 hypothetical protein [Nocardioides luti]